MVMEIADCAVHSMTVEWLGGGPYGFVKLLWGDFPVRQPSQEVRFAGAQNAPNA